MLTINQLSTRFIDFFNNHAQINTVIYADDFDFAAYPDIDYRVVHIQSVDSTVRGKEIINRFKFMIADMEDPNNQTSENEIWSDCELIADDFLSFFGDDDYSDFLTDTDTTYQRFSESGTDRTAGVVFTASVRQTREINACAIPVRNTVNDAVIAYYGSIETNPVWEDLLILNNAFTLSIELNTGLNNKFLVAVLQGYSIQRILDISASDLELTALYENQGTVTSDDNLVYDLYIMEQAVAYSTNHKHLIKLIKQ